MKPNNLSPALIAALGLAAAPVHAALVNTGFESNVVTANGLSLTTPTSWASSGTGSKYVADGTALPGISSGHLSDQYFMLYVTSGKYAMIRQQDPALLWSNFTVGDTLTVSAWTTYRSDVSGAANTYFWLNNLNDSTLYSTPVNVTVDAAAGEWTLRTWNYVITQPILDAANAGAGWGAVEVGVGAVWKTGGGTDQQVAFDDVSLVYTPIPEPSAALLGGLGTVLLLRRRRI